MEKRNNAVGPQVRAAAGQQTDRNVRIVFAAGSLIIGLVAATQMFAHQFAYQEALGASFHHFYPPWRIIEWAIWYANEFPAPVRSAEMFGFAVTTMLMIFSFLSIISGSRKVRASEFLHGSARWADKKDINDAGLIDNGGVYVGAWRDKKEGFYLRHNGPEHVLCFAPTRTGKGVGLVIPTLLSWEQSAVILDLKGELWQLTSGCRKEKWNNKVLRFEPASATGSICFNPLEEIRLGTEHEVGDVQNIATLIVDPDGRGLNDHWQKTSQSLLVGVILHLLYVSKEKNTIPTLGMLDKMLADPALPVAHLWESMATNTHLEGWPHPVVAAAGRDMEDRAGEEAGSVLSSAKSYLALYRDPVVAKNTSKSEFRIRDLMNDDDPVSLYIITQPNDKNRLRPLVRILMNMIVRLLADRMEFEDGMPKPHYKHRMLMMLDEFLSLGKLEIMQESLAFIAGYGIKCYLIVQDIIQLQSPIIGYGREESITSNCHIQVAFQPNRIETAEYLSKLTGVTTVSKEQITSSGPRINPFLEQVSRTMHEVQRPLLTPDECMRMPGPVKDRKGMIKKAGDMLVFCAGFPAIYGQQPLYFKDKIFLAWSKIKAPKVTDILINDDTAKKDPDAGKDKDAA